MMLHDLTRRTVFRVALIFTSLSLLTVGLVFALIYQLITAGIESKLRTHVTEVRDALLAENDSDGLDGLKKLIDSLGAPTADDEVIYLLTAPDGNYIAGNLVAAPRFEGWKELPWKTLRFKGDAQKSDGTDAALATWTQIKDGFLLVGEGDGDVDEAQKLMRDGLFWAISISILTAGLGGVVLGLGAQKRINALENTLDLVAQGKLSARAQVSSSNDDLDHVAQRINATLDQLEKTVETLGQISSDIAHDLKTPISHIQQRVQIALSQPMTPDAHRNTLSEIQTELDSVTSTFDALLRIAQIEGGARKSRFAPVRLSDVVDRVVEAYEYVGEDTNHMISSDRVAGIEASINGDHELLVLLLSNLIENAIRHTPAGSRLRVALSADSHVATVTVSDNGPGIPANEREKVFRRLYRPDKSRTTPGSGLGLSLVAAIAALHDAKIALSDNEPGLAVNIEFPLVRLK